MSFSITGFFKSMETDLHNFFTKHGGAIQAGLAEAATAVTVAASVATIAGAPAGVASELSKVTSALSIVQTGVSAESTATDLTQHAANLAGVVSALVNSGDINVTNAQTQAAIGVVATKVQGVVGVLESAATVAPVATK